MAPCVLPCHAILSNLLQLEKPGTWGKRELFLGKHSRRLGSRDDHSHLPKFDQCSHPSETGSKPISCSFLPLQSRQY
jgi:hypothetical protein